MENDYKKLGAYRGWIIGHHNRTGYFVERWGVRLNVNSYEHGKRRIDERAIEYPWEVNPAD